MLKYVSTSLSSPWCYRNPEVMVILTNNSNILYGVIFFFKDKMKSLLLTLLIIIEKWKLVVIFEDIFVMGC